MNQITKVVIVGVGFGGLQAAKALKSKMRPLTSCWSIRIIITPSNPCFIRWTDRHRDGALMELFKMVLSKDFPRLEVAQARVVLVEAQNRLLAPFHEKLRQNALQTLRKQGVEVLLNEDVTRATADAVYLKSGTIIRN